VRGGEPAAAIGIGLGAGLALLSSRGAGQRWLTAAAVVAITAVAATGELERFLP
jgi:F0F1-type ATP synthase membrane subunit c/vacuolar-type H+-ATPase subunit K